jgi:uncharacterized protein (DUF362 family)
MINRREFIKQTGKGALALSVLSAANISSLFAQKEIPHAVWVENGEPPDLLKAALNEYGGMNHFISRGDIVVVKPNIGWDRAPQYAADSNPDLVAEIIKACYNAGAKTVKVFDRTCNNPRRCYKNSQIEEKASAVDAEVTQIRDEKFVNLAIKNGKMIKEWPIYKEYLEADKVINVPIAKHHSMSRLTLGLKNLMGVMGENRGSLHADFDIKINDIDSNILPTLTIMDAYRILTANGPVGGNLSQVRLTKTLIMSPCLVTTDYLTLDLFGVTVQEVGHIREAINRGLNKYDLKKLNLKKIVLS